MSEKIIRAVNLNKVYKDGAMPLHILKDVNLYIEEAEFVSIVGPSGAGKSTLLHLLAGLDMPTKGNVIFDGVDLYKISANQRAMVRNLKIGFVFQFYHLMPDFSAVENVIMPALIRNRLSAAVESKKEAAERAKRLLRLVGLSDRMAHKPVKLSGGEQQRVAIARALINSPKALYCDEPTGNLDSKTGSGIIDVLLNLNRQEGITCVMVTHEHSLSQKANRVLSMEDGKIL